MGVVSQVAEQEPHICEVQSYVRMYYLEKP